MKIQLQLAIVLFLLTAAFIFYKQVPDAGFREGHRGWVASHALCIIQRASPSNGFLGYTMAFVDEEGTRSYRYFDRYPVFFSAAMHAALNIFDLKMRNQIYVARQIMNIIYVLTLVMAIALLLEVGVRPVLAIGAATFVGSGYWLFKFRDMVHFDQPALLGFTAMMWAIARWYRVRDNRTIYIVTCLAVLLGRGYASFAVLGTWWILDSIRLGKDGISQAPKRILLGVPTRACLLSIAVAATCLSYNILMEAKFRDVPIAEVGIIDSASRRFVVSKKMDRYSKYLKWDNVIKRQGGRLLRGIKPGFTNEFFRKSDISKNWAYLGIFLVIGIFIATRQLSYRIPLIIMTIAGPIWLVLMRGLTSFHVYTAMFFLGLNLVFYAAILSIFPSRIQLVPVLLACAFLVTEAHIKNNNLERASSSSEMITEDMQDIVRHLKPGDQIVVEPSYRKIVKGVPYALGFYLPKQYIQTKGPGTLYLTRNKDREGTNLTPDNHKVFLYKTEMNGQ